MSPDRFADALLAICCHPNLPGPGLLGLNGCTEQARPGQARPPRFGARPVEK